MFMLNQKLKSSIIYTQYTDALMALNLTVVRSALIFLNMYAGLDCHM